MADGGGLDGARFRAFGQYDAFVCLAGGFHHVVAELRGRQTDGLFGGQFCHAFGCVCAAQIVQTGCLGGFGRTADHAGKFDVASGKRCFGHLQAFGGGVFVADGEDDAGVERGGQAVVLAAQEDIGIVRGDALDDDVFLTQRGGAADQQVEPVVRFAFGRQADGFVGIVHCVEYRGIRQFRRDVGGGFGRINMRADGDNQGVGHVFVLSGKLFDTGVSVSNISGTTDKLMGTADWGNFTINYNIKRSGRLKTEAGFQTAFLPFKRIRRFQNCG